MLKSVTLQLAHCNAQFSSLTNVMLDFVTLQANAPGEEAPLDTPCFWHSLILLRNVNFIRQNHRLHIKIDPEYIHLYETNRVTVLLQTVVQQEYFSDEDISLSRPTFCTTVLWNFYSSIRHN